jgi:hypothetical protein
LFGLTFGVNKLKAKKTGETQFTLDPDNPPLLTDEQNERLDAVSVMPDDQIDYSDAPELPDAFFVTGDKGQ